MNQNFFNRNTIMQAQDRYSFAERYSRRWLLANAALSVFLMASMLGSKPVVFALYAVVIVLSLQRLIRKRQMEEERRGNETIEDERDGRIQADASHWNRVALVIGTVGTAVAMSIPAARDMLLTRELFLSGWLLLLVIVADSIGHAVVIAMHKKDRS
jgi:hypothetical protein